MFHVYICVFSATYLAGDPTEFDYVLACVSHPELVIFPEVENVNFEDNFSAGITTKRFFDGPSPENISFKICTSPFLGP